MRIGFTGTRQGMTAAQVARLYDFLCEQPDLSEFHHGDCVGADDEAADVLHEIVTGEDPGPPIKVVSHPPVFLRYRAFNTHFDKIRCPKDYLERNRDIVNECDLLIACPAEMTEKTRGGTWGTVRYARQRGKSIIIIWPDGTTTEEAVPS